MTLPRPPHAHYDWYIQPGRPDHTPSTAPAIATREGTIYSSHDYGQAEAILPPGGEPATDRIAWSKAYPRLDRYIGWHLVCRSCFTRELMVHDPLARITVAAPRSRRPAVFGGSMSMRGSTLGDSLLARQFTRRMLWSSRAESTTPKVSLLCSDGTVFRVGDRGVCHANGRPVGLIEEFAWSDDAVVRWATFCRDPQSAVGCRIRLRRSDVELCVSEIVMSVGAFDVVERDLTLAGLSVL